MQSFFQDVRYALRQLHKSPGFTAIAVASLALAIGANTTIFSFANQLLYVTVGLPKPSELRLLSITNEKESPVHGTWGSSWPGDDGKYHIDTFSYPAYEQLRNQNTVLSGIAAYKNYPSLNITADGNAITADAELVSGNFYQLMQLKPELGRGILPADDGAPGTGNVVVLSDSFWHKAFGGATDVIGKTVSVNTLPFTVVGVNPPQYLGPDGAGQPSPQVYIPLSMAMTLHPSDSVRDRLTGANFWWLQLVGRTRSGVSDAQAQASLQVALSAAIRGTMTVAKNETIPNLVLDDGSRGTMVYDLFGVAKQVYLLLGFAGLVLLLACANIANLMLARATSRQREMSLRMAIGAGRLRILRQVLTESVLLSALGGIAGLCLGYLGRNLIPYLMQQGWEGGDLNTPFDWRVFGFTSAITLATGVLFGLLPAWRATSTSLNETLKEGSRGASRRRKAWSGKAIVGFQVALSTLLVMAAVFFARTIINLNSIDPGFRTQNLLLFGVNPPSARYPSPKNIDLDHRLEAAFASLPGVQGTTIANIPLVSDSAWRADFVVEGERKLFDDNDDRGAPFLDYVGANFFSVMQIPILAGRGFNAQDSDTSTLVSVINQSLAKLYFPNQNPIGRRFRIGDKGSEAQWIQIVGICADTRYRNMREPAPPIHFEPYRQHTDIGQVDYIVKSSLPAATLVPALRNAVKQIDPDLPLTEIRTYRQQIDAVMQQERMFAAFTAGFGILALALACVGVYGIMAYTVSQRTNEIGIRLALGAARAQVRAMVLSETAWLALVGVIIGLGATLALTHVIASMLYGLKPYDPITLAGSMLILLLVAFLAGFIPAQRASQVDPIEALRTE